MTSTGRPVKPPRHRNRLEQLIGQHARAQGLPAGRVRNWVSFMVFAGAIARAAQADGSPLFWFKGGLAMEARFGNTRARATRDVDAVFRLGLEDEKSLLAALDSALADDYHGFTFEVPPLVQLGDARYRQTRIRLSFNGRAWGTVRLEISAPEGSAQIPEMVPALPLGFAGLQGPATLPCLPIPLQIAQKLHAVTERFAEPRQNDRQRDIIDLLLLRELVDDLAAVRAAAVEIFDGRGKHPWPPPLDSEPNWTIDYPADAQRFGFPIEDLDRAITELRVFIADIDEAHLEPDA